MVIAVLALYSLNPRWPARHDRWLQMSAAVGKQRGTNAERGTRAGGQGHERGRAASA
jgi:hypothetical protein